MTNIFTSVDSPPLFVIVFDGYVDGDKKSVAICPHLGAMRVTEEDEVLLGLVAVLKGRSITNSLAKQFLGAARAGAEGDDTDLQPLDYTKFEKLGFCGMAGGKLKGGATFQQFPDTIDAELADLCNKVGADDTSASEVAQVVHDYITNKGITTFDVNAKEVEA